MSENTTAAGELASQYAAQVTGDLERNVKEQERISAEIAALQEQLVTLQQDHAVLVNMQQALGVTPVQVQPATAPATVPAPRTKAAPDRARKGTRAKRKTTAAPAPAKPQAKKPAAGKAPAKVTATASASASKTPSRATSRTTSKSAPKAASPTLVELVRAHLAEQGEPRSAAEVSTALGQAHADRSFKTTVVRNTLENLVAKGQAQRSKQGSSVFYTAPDAAEQQTSEPQKPESPSDAAKPEQSA
ncbi:hypothetical protein AB0M97_23640 [Streptomyces sp. NPDC051207]|uniref:hypothetical protein n=1 Tax=Streptomyces sp. NPDC051207 TaxID=3154641 RepID=UPI003442A073